MGGAVEAVAPEQRDEAAEPQPRQGRTIAGPPRRHRRRHRNKSQWEKEKEKEMRRLVGSWIY